MKYQVIFAAVLAVMAMQSAHAQPASAVPALSEILPLATPEAEPSAAPAPAQAAATSTVSAQLGELSSDISPHPSTAGGATVTLSASEPASAPATAPAAPDAPATAAAAAAAAAEAHVPTAAVVAATPSSAITVQEDGKAVSASVKTMTAISVLVPADGSVTSEPPPCDVFDILTKNSLTKTAALFKNLKATVPANSTLFAPTDDAWDALLGALSLSLFVSIESDATLTSTLLEGHVLPQVVFLDHCTDGDSYDTVLEDETVSIARSIVFEGVSPFKGFNIKVVPTSIVQPAGQIIEGDIVNTCGVLHIIDHVLVSATAAALPAPTEKQVEVITLGA